MRETPPMTRMTRMPRQRRLALIVAVPVVIGLAAAVTIGIVAANATRVDEPNLDEFPMIELDSETMPPGLELANPEDLEHMGGAMDLEVMEWQTQMQISLYDDPNLGSVAISPDGQILTITWYGEPNHILEQHLAEAPEGIEVVIQSAAFPPGELQELVMQTMQPGFVPGVQIATGGVEQDGSGMHFGLVDEPKGKTLAEIANQISRALGRSDVPIRVEVSGAVVPISGSGFRP